MSEQEKRGLSDSDLENIAGGKLSKKEELEKHGNPKKPHKPKLEPFCAYMGPDKPVSIYNTLKKEIDKDDK